MSESFFLNDKSRHISALVSVLEQEYSVHVRYLDILSQESVSLTKLKPDEITKFSEQRENLHAEMHLLQEKRNEIIRRITGLSNQETVKISEIIAKHCNPNEAKVLKILSQKLKDAVTKVRSQSEHHSELLGFSSGLVNSVMSIIWSATQSVVSSYGPKGILKQAYQPAASGPVVERKA